MSAAPMPLHDAHVKAWNVKIFEAHRERQATIHGGVDDLHHDADGQGAHDTERQAIQAEGNGDATPLWTGGERAAYGAGLIAANEAKARAANVRALRGAQYLDNHAGALEFPLQRRPLDWTALAGREIPQRDWAIDHWLGMRHVTLLAGPGGGGKSLLAQQIGSALALGHPFIDAVPLPRTVLMWAAEDDEHELWRRQHAIAQSMNVNLQDFAGKFIVESFDGRDCTLAAVSYGTFGVTAKLEEFRQQVNDYRVDVAILDNIARLYGGNENDRHQVTAFIAELVGAAAERGAAVLLLGHPGRASGSEFSGSSAWENAVRARLWLSDKLPDQPRDDGAEPESDVRYLARRKANYSAHDLRTFRYQNGLFVPEAGEPVSGGLMDHTRRIKAERVVLDAFRGLTAMGQSPSDATNSSSYLPKPALDYKLGEGLTKRELADAMRQHMKDGKLKRQQIGVYGNRNPRFGLKES